MDHLWLAGCNLHKRDLFQLDKCVRHNRDVQLQLRPFSPEGHFDVWPCLFCPEVIDQAGALRL